MFSQHIHINIHIFMHQTLTTNHKYSSNQVYLLKSNFHDTFRAPPAFPYIFFHLIFIAQSFCIKFIACNKFLTAPTSTYAHTHAHKHTIEYWHSSPVADIFAGHMLRRKINKQIQCNHKETSSTTTPACALRFSHVLLCM